MSKWPTHRPYSYKRLQYRLLIWTGYEYEIYFEDTSIRRFINISEDEVKDIVELLNVAYSLGAEETKSAMEYRAST